MREKHIIGGLLCSCLLLGSLTGCGADWKGKLLYGYEKTLSSLGGFQRTSKLQLHGMRLDGEDAYTGTYRADCRNGWSKNGIVEIYVLGNKEGENEIQTYHRRIAVQLSAPRQPDRVRSGLER